MNNISATKVIGHMGDTNTPLDVIGLSSAIEITTASGEYGPYSLLFEDLQRKQRLPTFIFTSE